MTKYDIIEFINKCTKLKGGATCGDLAQAFPPIEEYIALRRILHGLMCSGIVIYNEDKGGYTTA